MLGILVLVFVLVLLFRWRIFKVRRQMEEQFGVGPDGQPSAGGAFGGPFARGSRREPRRGREGEVKVHRTVQTPEKRVSKNVGDYVEFEETVVHEQTEQTE